MDRKGRRHLKWKVLRTTRKFSKTTSGRGKQDGGHTSGP
jgi:hypothetical protein